MILRRFVRDDAQEMYNNWASDPEVTRFLTWPVHENAAATAALLDLWISEYADETKYNWVMELRDTGEIIGNLSIVSMREDVASMEIGYCMSRKWWGQGYMPEALTAVIAYLFTNTDVNRIEAKHDVNNPKSGRVMDKAGMTAEGVLRAYFIGNQGLCDTKVHSILRSEWMDQNKRSC